LFVHTVIRTRDGREVRLGHGDVIGRLWSAALSIDDPRVSEAHAMVSLRHGELHLLALRGRFSIDDKRLASLRLQRGQRIRLSRETTIEVVDVFLPRELLAIRGPGLPAQVLSGVCGLIASEPPELVSPLPEDPDAVLWHNGSGWRLRTVNRARGPCSPATGSRWATTSLRP